MIATKDLKERIKANPQLKALSLWLMAPTSRPRPRWFIRHFVNPFFHKKGRGALIRRNSRIDVFPYNRFEVGANSTIESYCVVNNGVGDVIIGDNCRIGIGTVVNGPMRMGDGSGTGQHVFLGGFNHVYSDGDKNSNDQPVDTKGIIIEEDSHIGANSVIVAGVTIGKRCQIGAGSVVTKSIPPYSIAVGNPAKVIKRFNSSTKTWDRVDK